MSGYAHFAGTARVTIAAVLHLNGSALLILEAALHERRALNDGALRVLQVVPVVFGIVGVQMASNDCIDTEIDGTDHVQPDDVVQGHVVHEM